MFNRTITNIPSGIEANLDDDSIAIEDEENQPMKRRRSSSNGEQSKIFENIAHTLKENNFKRNELIQKILADSKAQSELELYFGSICKTVERFSLIEQARVKMQISQIVSQAELSHFEKRNFEIVNINGNNILSNGSNIETLSFEDGSTFSTIEVPIDHSYQQHP